MSHQPFIYDGPSKDSLLAIFGQKSLRSVRTPALVIDRAIFTRNCAKMHENAEHMGAQFRPHLKSHKTTEGTKLQLVSEAGKSSAVVVSTLMEAWQLLRSGLVEDGTVNDILYGFPIPITRLAETSELARKLEDHGTTLHILLDHPDQVEALQTFSQTSQSDRMWRVFVKVDSGYKRAGLPPDSRAFKELLKTLIGSPSISIVGFYAHSGHSYDSTSFEDASNILAAEIESVNNAASLALSLFSTTGPAARFILSVGSTPVANSIPPTPQFRNLNGVLELHAGNYPLLDLQQESTRLVDYDRISIRVLATVVSYYPGRGADGGDEALCDAGSVALSKDTGPSGGFGDVTKLGCRARVSRESVKWKVKKASQEHGILVRHASAPRGEQSGCNSDADRGETLQVGDMVEIVPQHACLAAAAHPWFYIVDSDLLDSAEKIVDVWVPWKGW